MADCLSSRYALEPAVRRYALIYETFLDMKGPISTYQAAFRMRQAMERRGLRTSKMGHEPLLSDLLFETFPLQWLFDHFDIVGSRPTGKFELEIDSIGRLGKRSGATFYALALAALEDEVDDCVNEFLRPLTGEERSYWPLSCECAPQGDSATPAESRSTFAG